MTVYVLEEVAKERDRQEVLLRTGELEWIASMPHCPDSLRFAALLEEMGEVARAYHEGDYINVRHELVHVAAVAVAWIEGMEP